MSRSILKLSDGPSAGYRWLRGQTKSLPSDALAARVLCKSHNQRLSKLDDVGFAVFEAMRACALGEPGPKHLIVNGHDFERWIVQRACAVCFSGNADHKGLKVDLGQVARGEIFDALVEGKWRPSGGLYLTASTMAAKLDGTEMAPVFGVSDRSVVLPQVVVGFRVSLAGIPFAVRWAGNDQVGPGVADMFYAQRMDGVNLVGPEHTLQIRFTWGAGIRPGPIIEFGPLTREMLAETRAKADDENSPPSAS